MSPSGDSEQYGALTPDEAFSILGNETRIEILRTLGEADRSLSFTDLRERVGVRQGAQFNYHLDKVVGHFVAKTDDGYALREPGRRVVQSVLSGAVTEDPVLEPTEIDYSCHYCGAPVEVSYSQGRLQLSCTECSGNYDESTVRRRDVSANLSNMSLPPAGVQGRTAADALRTAATTSHLDAIAASNDICPRCSAPLDHSVSVCENHDASDGLCEVCEFRWMVRFRFQCTNCIYDQEFPAVMVLLDVPELLVFVGRHGLNTSSRGIEWGWDYEEEIISLKPFRGRFTLTIENEALVVTVDEDLSMIDIVREFVDTETC